MKPSVGGGDESYDSNATPKIKTAGPEGRQFREWTDVRSADQTATMRPCATSADSHSLDG